MNFSKRNVQIVLSALVGLYTLGSGIMLEYYTLTSGFSDRSQWPKLVALIAIGIGRFYTFVEGSKMDTKVQRNWAKAFAFALTGAFMFYVFEMQAEMNALVEEGAPLPFPDDVMYIILLLSATLLAVEVIFSLRLSTSKPDFLIRMEERLEVSYNRSKSLIRTIRKLKAEAAENSGKILEDALNKSKEYEEQIADLKAKIQWESDLKEYYASGVEDFGKTIIKLRSEIEALQEVADCKDKADKWDRVAHLFDEFTQFKSQTKFIWSGDENHDPYMFTIRKENKRMELPNGTVVEILPDRSNVRVIKPNFQIDE